MPETEGFVLAAQDQAITTNALRCNIFHLPVTPPVVVVANMMKPLTIL